MYIVFINILIKKKKKIDNIDNNWLAVPVMLDFRVLKFNITTFDYCISQGYNLKYPPVVIKKI